MSMEDILKVLASSRQQGNSTQGTDPMAELLGGLLGGGQSQSHAPLPSSHVQPPSQGGVNLSDGIDAGDVIGLLGGLMNASQQQPQAAASQQPVSEVSGMMSMLEMVMGGGNNPGTNDPIMNLLKPYIAPLAKKANISPEIAMIVVSFVAHKLLAHHPSSGRDSNTFNFEDMVQQMGSGKIDTRILKDSGMTNELSRKTGLDEATAAKSLDMAFSLVGRGVAGAMNQNATMPTAKPSAAGAARPLGVKNSAGAKKR